MQAENLRCVLVEWDEGGVGDNDIVLATGHHDDDLMISLSLTWQSLLHHQIRQTDQCWEAKPKYYYYHWVSHSLSWLETYCVFTCCCWLTLMLCCDGISSSTLWSCPPSSHTTLIALQTLRHQHCIANILSWVKMLVEKIYMLDRTVHV